MSASRSDDLTSSTSAAPQPLLAGGGEMGERTRAHPWHETSLGAIADWPTSLRTAVGVVLGCQVPMFLAWGEGLLQFYNDAFAPILGTRHPQALGTDTRATWPEIWDTVGPMWARVLRGEAIGANDFRLTMERHGYPEDCWFNFSYSPVPDDAGRPTGVLVTVIETTRRVRAERRARFQLELADGLRGMATPDEVTRWTCRLLGERFDARRAGYATIRDGAWVEVDLPGWFDDSVQSVLGQSFPLAAIGPDVARELGEGRTVRLNDVHADPRTRGYPAVYDGLGAASMLIVPVVRGRTLIAVVAVSGRAPRVWTDEEAALTEDAAERTRSAVERAVAEHALHRRVQAERDRMRLLFDQAPVFMAALRGPDHLFELTNPAFERVVGRLCEGRTVREALPEAAEQGFIDLLDGVYSTGQPHAATNARFELQHDDGQLLERFVDYIYQPIIEPDGSVSGIFVVGSDVTERKHAEDALRRSEQRAAEAMRELQEADRRKDEFLAMLAHELRNPLAPISTAAQLLGMPGADGPRIQQVGAIISRQVAHMTALVDDLLDVSRVTRGLAQLQRERLELAGVVAAAVEQVRPLLESRRHTLTVRHATAPALVDGDRTRLVQVVVNLLGNAARYTPEGGEISVATDVHAQHVVLAVSDNGSGIEPELLPRIFDLFTQGARTPDRAHGGLGLGLALVRNLVALHGGSVEARSAGAGQGSTFTMTLPLAGPAPGGDEASAEGDPAVATHGRRILLVDDNQDAASTLGELLRVHGHTVQVGHDGEEALAAAAALPEAPFEVFILDIGLPGMDGHALARRLRELHPQACFIALTGYGQPGDKERARSAGFDHHMVKPPDVARLLAIVQGIG